MPLFPPTQRREGNISNPRVLSDMGLAIPRPTRLLPALAGLGDPRSCGFATTVCASLSPCIKLLRPKDASKLFGLSQRSCNVAAAVTGVNSSFKSRSFLAEMAIGWARFLTVSQARPPALWPTFADKINLSNTTDAASWRVEIAGEGADVVVSWWETNQTSDTPVARLSTDGGQTFGPTLMLATNGTIGTSTEEEDKSAQVGGNAEREAWLNTNNWDTIDLNAYVILYA